MGIGNGNLWDKYFMEWAERVLSAESRNSGMLWDTSHYPRLLLERSGHVESTRPSRPPLEFPWNFHGIPGVRFVAGHSHQLFHVCGILGTHFQLEAVSMDMAERRGRLPIPSSLETFGSLGIGAAGSLAILGICFRRLRPERFSREKSR